MASPKVLGILGSPLMDGNTADLLEAVLEGARSVGAETERLDLSRMHVNPCLECKACDSAAVCAHADDDMGLVYKRLREVDVVVLASPIFFMGVSAQTKAMIDRCQCFWVERFVLKIRHYEGTRRPRGFFVSCAGGSKPTMFDSALHVVRAWYSALDYEYAGEVLLGHTDDPNLAERKKVALDKAVEAGRRISL